MGETALGSVINRKYRLVAELGHGAMGVVYRAEQLDSEGHARRPVALKTLRPEFSTDANFARRFLREIGVAMQLRSPRIVTVYDCGKDEQGQLYYAMELLPQTLKDWVAEHRPLAVEQVVQIIGQICEGLAEAHGLAEPVVHRDLKPANVFVEYRQGQLEVKIGDFGIAKVVGEHTDGLTHSDGAASLGTPRYMAPEQWNGQAVDGRTDLYALGVMFYELLTGHPPFTGSGGVSVLMAQHLQHPPPPLPNSIPTGIREVVMQLLAKLPASRPADALSVKRALAAVPQDPDNIATALLQPDHKRSAPDAEAHTSIATPEVPHAQRDSGADRFQQSRPSHRRKFFGRVRRAHWLSVAGLLLVVATLVTLRYFPLLRSLLSPPRPFAPNIEPGLPTLPLPDKPSIAVLPFTNMSGDPEQDYFSDGLTDTLITDLSKISGLFVIARHSVFTYKGQAVKVEQVSQELGVRYVLEGSVQKADDRVRINVQFVDGTTGGHLWAERYDRPFANLFTLQDDLLREVMTVLRIEVLEAELTRVQRVATENLTAYDFVLRGLAALYRAVYENSQAANAQARQSFEKAVALDPTYAEAHALLGATYFNDWLFLWNFTPETLERAATLAQQAVGLDSSLPLPHLTLGMISLFQKTHEQGMAEVEQAIALDPNWADAYVQLGQTLGFVGRPEEGIEVITKAMRLNPRYPDWYLLYLGMEYRHAERCEEALTPLQKVVARNPDFGPARVNLVVCYAHLGRQQEAEAELAKVLQLWPTWSLEIERQQAPYKNPADLERYLEGLRKAGLK